jgi:hypothetical protein
MTQGIAAFGRDLDSVRQGLKDAAVKKECLNKSKFRMLKRRLGKPLYAVAGILELLWITTQVDAVDGSIGKLSNEEIAAALEWDGDADFLINTLIETGWIDTDSEFRLVIHDWSDHVPTFIKGAFERHHKPFADQLAKQRAKHGAKEVALHGAGEAAGVPAGEVALARPNLTKPNQTKVCAATPMPECLQTNAFQEAWTDWQQHRKEIKKELKPTMIVQQLKWLAKLGHDKAIATIENTITKGWVGLKEPEAVDGGSRESPKPVRPRLPTPEEDARWSPTTGID